MGRKENGAGGTARRAVFALLGVLFGLALMTAPTALAKDGDVVRSGPCTAASDWKLKLSPENGRIEVEFEVDQNRNGDTWRVVLRRNGNVFFTGNRVTQPPSGSFEVRRVISNPAGPDTIRGRAMNLRTGEICKGQAVANF